jgi:Fur family zinc uptake transcriptional regulator
MQKQETLTKNQKIILDLIEKSDQPLKAYSILFDVKKKGINAPLQVYRALNKLVKIVFIIFHSFIIFKIS